MATPKYFNWGYYSKLEVGSSCRTFIPQRFQQMGSRRIALIADPGIVQAGIVDKVMDVIEAQNVVKVVGIYDKIQQDALMGIINDCARWCRELAVDGLLAVGGGSVLDSVKGVKALIGMKSTDIREIMPNNLGLYKDIAQPLGIPHIAVATTAGTGSETSTGAVIFNEFDKVKGVLQHPFTAAEYAFLDPDLTVGLPPHLTAFTGFDALCHAVEAAASPESNCMIDAFSIQAIKLIAEYLPIAVQDGKNLEARTKMLIASNMAIMSFCMAGGICPIHNFAHAVGAYLRVPHGEANAVFMPAVLESFPLFYARNVDVLADAFGVNKEGKSPEELVAACAQALRDLQAKCGVSPMFAWKLDAKGLERLFGLVKSDPAGFNFPLPDDVVKAALNASFDKA